MDSAVPPLIRLRDAVVRRGGHDLLTGIDLDLCAGEHLAVLGSNGAGKSTLLALLRGDLPPTAGNRAYDFGAGLQTSPIGLRERMGLVSAGLQERFAGSGWRISAQEAVAAAFQDSWLCYSPPTQAELEQAEAALGELGAAGLADQPVSNLSTGQLRLVLLARAMVTRPEVLFLDEFLDGLDVRSRALLLRCMERVAGQCTLVCAAHREQDIPMCVEQGVLLRDGAIKARGPLTDLQRRRRAPAGLPELDLPPSAAVHAPYLFQLENASVVFSGRRALDQVNWTARPGEHWAVLGGNGAGKSTLLRVLLGLVDLYPGGRLGWFGVDELPDLTHVRRTVGYVSPLLQGEYSYDLPVRETVWSGFFGSVGLYEEPDEEQKDRAEAALAFCGLQKFADRRIRTLSYGQLRRVLLARAAVSGPPVLFLDEPLSGLDSRSRPQALELLERLARTGTHLVYVTHHTEELFPAVDHVLRLDQGRVVFCGPRAAADL
ncbi:MAG: ABC transporter ATP-binding protein [Desulfovibrio sp.]